MSPLMLVKPPLGAFLGLYLKEQKALITFPSFNYYYESVWGNKGRIPASSTNH